MQLLFTLLALLPSVDVAHRTIRFDPNQDKTLVLTIHHEVGLAIRFSQAPDVVWYSNRENYTVETLSPETLIVKVILEAEEPMNLFAMIGDALVEILLVQTASLEDAVRKATIEVLPSKPARIAMPKPERPALERKLLEEQKIYDLASFSVWKLRDEGGFVIYQKPESPRIEVLEILRGKQAKFGTPVFHTAQIHDDFITLKIPPIDLEKKEKVYLSVVLQQSALPIVLELLR